MLFNSIEFAIFLPIVFALYWGVFQRNLKLQNLFLLIVSYVFYGWWDWRFLSLIIFTSSVDFFAGIGMGKFEKPAARKLILMASILANLGLLGFFKYYNFFAESFAKAFTLFGQHLNVSSLNIILPVGISFYTFQSLGYAIDAYRRNVKPTKDPIAFLAFVSFFPQLVAGPIERAAHLLPQFFVKRRFDYDNATDGLRYILWGLFTKIVIADNCAYLVNKIYANPETQTGSALLMAAFLFTIQIYGDFSGYSSIAIGTARLFGFELMRNFAYPFFSRDIAEFWRRWHISLSTWFRDYLYVPLGGNRSGKLKTIRNIFIVFIVAGLWHGANWTYVFWGFLHAVYFLPLILFNLNQYHSDIASKGRIVPTAKDAVNILITFLLFAGSMIFFRLSTINQGFLVIRKIFSSSLLTFPEGFSGGLMLLIIIMIGVEWLQREKEHALDFSGLKIPFVVRYIIYYALVLLILLYAGKTQEFIYFQF